MTVTQNLIYAELHLAIAQNGEDWVLRFLKNREKPQTQSDFVIESVCREFEISKHDFLGFKGTDARRIAASVLYENNFKIGEIANLLNRSKQVIRTYLSFINEIESNKQLFKMHIKLLEIKSKIQTQYERRTATN